MSKKFLQQVKNKSSNPYVALANESSIYDISGYVDTKTPVLNAILSNGDINNGLCLGKRYVLSGESSTGKSFFTYQLLKSWLDSDPDRIGIVFESEGSTVQEMMTSIGIDKERVLIYPVITIEEMRYELFDNLTKISEDKSLHGKCMFILDSLGMLSSEKEMKDTDKGDSKVDFTKNKQIKAMFRTITLKVSQTQSVFLTVTHVYKDVGLFPTANISGGQSLAYAGDVILYLSKSSIKEGTIKTGVKIKMTCMKTRFMREGSSIDILLSFTKGIYKYSSLMELAIETGAITNKNSKVYIFPDGQEAQKAAVLKNPKQYWTEENKEVIRKALLNKWSFGEYSIEDESEEIEIDFEEDE